MWIISTLWKYVGEGSLYNHGVMIVVTSWDDQESDSRSAQRPKQNTIAVLDMEYVREFNSPVAI